MISRDASCQVLSRPLLISKRQQDTLAIDGMVGDLNLMTSQDFDNYFFVNGTFYLARGRPSSSTNVTNYVTNIPRVTKGHSYRMRKFG